jgi:hypothetical protein
VLALATHEHDLAQRAQAAAHTHEPLALQEVLGEARLGQEDIESTVPFGAPGREAAVVEAREVVRATTLLHSGAFALAQPHLDAAARAFSLVVSRARAG